MKHIRSTFFLLTTLFIMASCGEDRSGEYYALIGENVWIEQIMKEHYLWYDSIPAIKETLINIFQSILLYLYRNKHILKQPSITQ